MKLRQLLATIAVCLPLIACHRDGAPIQDNASMNPIPLRTVCIGRLLVDLPKQGVVNWTQQFDRAEVSRLPILVNSESQYRLFIEARKKELESQHHQTELSLLSLAKTFDGKGDVLLFRESQFDDVGYDMERYIFISDRGYRLTTKALANEKKNALEGYLGIYQRLVPINNSLQPTSPGFCIDGAMVTGDVGQIGGGPSVEAFGMKNVSLSVGTVERVEPPSDGTLPTSQFDDLEDDRKGFNQMKGSDPSGISAFDVLLKRTRKAAGFQGQETAYRVKYNTGRYKYRFDWQTDIKKDCPPERPRISISLFFDDEGPNENPPVAPPPEDQMLALWNAVLNSARMRPGAF